MNVTLIAVRCSVFFALALMVTPADALDAPVASADPITRQPPPPFEYSPPPLPRHAPAFSLWTGVRGSYGLTDYLLKANPALTIDLGARINKRDVVYVMYQRRFDEPGDKLAAAGISVSYWSTALGTRFYIFRPSDAFAFVLDLFGGYRSLALRSDAGERRGHGLLLGFGGGIEYRWSTLVALSLLAFLDEALLSKSGDSFDVVSHGRLIDPQFPSGLSTAGLELGLHFDLFGK